MQCPNVQYLFLSQQSNSKCKTFIVTECIPRVKHLESLIKKRVNKYRLGGNFVCYVNKVFTSKKGLNGCSCWFVTDLHMETYTFIIYGPHFELVGSYGFILTRIALSVLQNNSKLTKLWNSEETLLFNYHCRLN